MLGEAGVEQLLKTTIEAAVDMDAVKRAEFECMIVDTTVQEKAVAHPSDSRLLEVARAKIAQLTTQAGIKLKQSYAPATATQTWRLHPRAAVQAAEACVAGH